jgi:hypothetical protein
MADINSYELSRKWFDWSFENPEKISPNHAAIYFFAIEHCNRLGWRNKFGFPTQMVMDAIGIKKHQTYIKYFNDLVEWGFFELVQKSINQYSANIISLVSAKPKSGKALDKAIITHAAKQIKSIGQSNGSINKPLTNKPLTNKPINTIPDFFEFKKYAFTHRPNISENDLKFKYESWLANDWKNGNDKKIQNWKSSLLNTLPYIKDGNNSNEDKPLKMVY